MADRAQRPARRTQRLCPPDHLLFRLVSIEAHAVRTHSPPIGTVGIESGCPDEWGLVENPFSAWLAKGSRSRQEACGRSCTSGDSARIATKWNGEA